MHKNRTAVRLNVPALLGVVALAGFGVAGCDSEGEQDLGTSAQIECNGLDASVDGGAEVDGGAADGGDAGGPIVSIDSGLNEPVLTAVTANGTGCPAGTWTSEIMADETEALVRFSAFDLEVAPEITSSIKDCTIGLQVRGVPGRSYQIERVGLHGVNHLDEGVSARLETIRYIQGNPSVNDTWQVELRGRTDEELSLESPDSSELWSPCGLERAINVRVSGRLLNNASRQGSGLVSLDQAHAFRLVSRACE